MKLLRCGRRAGSRRARRQVVTPTPACPRRGTPRARGHFLAAATRIAPLAVLAAMPPPNLEAQDARQIALLRGQIGVDGQLRRGSRAVATLTGIVRDSTSLEPVAFAEVRVSSTGAVARTAAGLSDRFGAFVIPDAPAGPARVEANAIGYAEWTRDYDQVPGAPIEIGLAPAPILLDSLGVEATGRTGDPISISPDAFVVDPAMIRSMPTVLETDVLRVLAMSPSASAPSDFVSMPHVRGGTSDGTPVMLDGVRLFNPFHLGGFLSAVNAEAVDHATLLPGSVAGAQHIGSLSGAIEIATRDGARDRHRMMGSVGLASSRLSVEGPLGETMSYLVNGRRTYIDLLTRGLALARIIEEHFPYSFSDLHAKVTRDFGGFRRFSATGYVSTEGIRYENVFEDGTLKGKVSSWEDFSWGNVAVVGHYRDRLDGGALLDVTLGHSRFGNSQFSARNRFVYTEVTDTVASGGGHMTEDRADVRATWHLSRGTLTAGGQAIRFTGDHDYELTDLEDILPLLTLHDRQWRIGAFANLDAPLGRAWRTRAGVRLDRFAGVATEIAPFAELKYVGAWWEARISAARSHQSLASLRNEESIGASYLAYDLMVPVEDGPIPRNTEISAGWDGSRGAWRWRLNAYANRLENLRLPVLPADPLQAWLLGDPSLHLVGGGTAMGIEATWTWARGPLSTVGSYRWGRVTRTVNDTTYVPRFHREHELEFGAALERDGSIWSARFSLRSGQPTTPILGLIPMGYHGPAGEHDTRWVVIEGDHNTARLPHYLRLDLGWRRNRRERSAGERYVMPFVSVTNLFSAPNVLAAEVREAEDQGVCPPFLPLPPGCGRGKVELETHYLPQMPMLAFFGVEFRF